jgi:SAM-dependent methyltransferase
MSTPATKGAGDQPRPPAVDDFDHHADTYREDVEHAVGWTGKDVDYFAHGKAEHLLGLVRRHLGDPAAQRVLDVGCGIGVTDRFLADRFAAFHGVDIAAEAVEKARRTNPSVRYHAYDGTALPFDADAFDVAFTICVMHHVPPRAWDEFASELGRVVRPGGLVVVFEHNPLNPLTRASVSRCRFDENVELLRVRTTERILRGAGLEVAERRYIFFLPLSEIAESRVERTLRRVPLGAQYFVAARP